MTVSADSRKVEKRSDSWLDVTCKTSLSQNPRTSRKPREKQLTALLGLLNKDLSSLDFPV